MGIRIQKRPPEGSGHLTAEEHTRMAIRDARRQRKDRQPFASSHTPELLEEIDALLDEQEQTFASLYHQAGGE